MAWGDYIKKYVGVAGDAIANIWQSQRSQRENSPDAQPPVGSQDRFGQTSTQTIGGISIATIAIVAGAYFLLRR